MSSILKFEHAFQSQRDQLIHCSNSRTITTVLISLLRTLPGNRGQSQLTSYYLELVPYLLRHITPETLKYRRVRDLDILADRLTDMKPLFPPPDYDRLHNDIVSAKICLFLFTGRHRELCQLLSLPEHSIAQGSGKPDGSPENILKQLLTRIQEESLRDILEDCLHEMETYYQEYEGQNQSLVALVEHIGNSKKEYRIIKGLLSPLKVSIDLLSEDAESDFITFNHKTISGGDLVYSQIENAFQFAKRYILGAHSAERTYYHASFSFHDISALYSGNSMGLAIGLVSIAALSKMEGVTYAYTLRDSVVATGSLDFSGAVNKVAPETLYEKLEAAFLSPAKIFILPFANYSAGQRHLERLKKRYPHKDFTLVPIKKIEDCLQNKRLVKREKRRLAHRLQSKRFRRRIPIYAALFLISLLSATLLAFITDNNPAKIVFNEKKVQALNAKGKMLWEHEFALEQPEIILQNRVDVYDYDQDGENEVFYMTANQHPDYDNLYYYESDGSVIWSYRENRTMVFGNETFIPNYDGGILLPVVFNNERTVFTVFSQVPWYPDVLMQFDYHGNKRQEYWNAGEILGLSVCDIERDGEYELIALGGNNDFDTATMAVFSIDNVSGYSPVDDANYIPRGIPPGTFKYFIRFPRFPRPDTLNTRDQLVQVLTDNSNLLSMTLSIVLTPPEKSDIIITLNSSIEIVKVEPGDYFLYRYQKKHGHSYWKDYQQEEVFEIMRKIRFWDGEGWTLTPTINPRWFTTKME